MSTLKFYDSNYTFCAIWKHSRFLLLKNENYTFETKKKDCLHFRIFKIKNEPKTDKYLFKELTVSKLNAVVMHQTNKQPKKNLLKMKFPL